jgi:GT2 family glycosyltransferase
VSADASPVISVVVPTKGRARYLERCLAALGESDYPVGRFETVVVDDSDGPDVARVSELAPAEAGVRVVSARGTGPSAARNTGATAARGRYVAFTDDDCEPAPGWLTGLERALEAHSGCAAGGATRNGASDDAAAEASQIVVDAVHAQFNRDPVAPRFFASNNVAFPATAFRDLGGFDEGFRYAEDREMCDRWVASGHEFVHAPDALVLHMRRLTARDFWSQHYGYGRGAHAFARSRDSASQSRADRRRVLGGLVRGRRGGNGARAPRRVAAYLALSQVATALGYAREAVARRLARRATGSGQQGR